ncbi:uncharacterized protein LOC124162743 [Ischnura elegans]|uniref:uncharacterized protein LOC124162743 n=1 Tax=Ischnura elegans TaxID=197161 RepID=UPI001ED8B222|nr:uncharacterized protein LOC124162743 [Ischnura elegans]
MVDTVQLITEVESRPCLWRLPDIHQSTRDTRKNTWREVASIVSPSWAGATESEQNRIVTEVKRKWKSVRDYHTRERREMEEEGGSSSYKKRKYVFSELLAFLDTLPRRSRGDKGAPSDDDDDPFCETMDETVDYSEEIDVREFHKYSARPERSEEPSLADRIGKQDEVRLMTQGEFHTEVLKLLRKEAQKKKPQKEEEEMDGDKMFLLSFLPSLRKMGDQQKLDFKLQMMHALRSVLFPNKPFITPRVSIPKSNTQTVPAYNIIHLPSMTTPTMSTPSSSSS